MNKQQTGQLGEQLAAHYLEQRGYKIHACNWRCRYGEIDLIAQKDQQVIFVEVRTRHARNIDEAIMSITPAKQGRMRRAAELFLSTLSAETADLFWRVDIIAIALTAGGTPQIAHLEDALDWE